MTTRSDREIGRAWVPASIALIAFATLAPQPEWFDVRQEFFGEVVPNRIGAWRDAFQNVLLYAPLGLLTGLRRVSLMRTLVAGALLSLTSELLQRVVPGRDSVAVDVVMNALGACVGWVVASTRVGGAARSAARTFERWWSVAFRPSALVAARLSLAWAALVSGTLGATCWLLSPSLPPPYFYAIAAPSIDRAPGPIRIGSDGTPRGVFNGLIDEVRIYSRARSDEEIRQDMDRAVSIAEPDPDLEAAYGFDSRDEEGGTIPARDDQVVNARRSPLGRFGGALALDGRATDGFVSNEPVDPRRGLTLEAWVFSAGPMRGDVPVIAGASDTFYLRASTFPNPSVPSSGGRFGAASRILRLRRPIPRERWTHLATTYDGQTMRLYVNGNVTGEMTLWSNHRPLRMSLNDVELPVGRVANPTNFQSLLLNEFTLGIAVTCGELQEKAAPVFMASGIQSIDALVIEAAAAELRVRYPSRASRLGFASADYRVPGAFSSCRPGETLSFAVKGPLQNPSVEDMNGAAMWGTGPSIASGWTVPIDSQRLPVWLVVTLSSCYMAVLILPFGFWARRSPFTVLGAVLFVGSLGLMPIAWKTRHLDAVQVVAVLSGLLLGILISRRRLKDFTSRV